MDGDFIGERRFPGRQGRLLFAYLVAEQGRAVPRDELAEALWGDDPPSTWEKALSVLISKLRGLLAEHGIDGATALTSAFGCYRLELPAGSWVDVVVATTAVQEAEQALEDGDVGEAGRTAALAESLVREPFLPGDDGTWVDEKRRELAGVRARALNVLVEARLRSGDAREAAKWAEQSIALEPFREGGYRRLMEAHVASGDRAEALRVYERCRRLLADELGTYPSPETDVLYRRLLEAPEKKVEKPLGASEPEGAPPQRSRSRRKLGVAAAIVAAGAAAGAGILATRGSESQASVAANSVVALNPSGSVAATISVGAQPVAIASAARSLWVANLVDRTVTRVDPASKRVVRTISIDGVPVGIAATKGGAPWVVDGSGRIEKLDPTYERVAFARNAAAADPAVVDVSASRPTLGAFGSLWLADPQGYVSRLDAASGRRIGRVDVGNDPSAIAAGAGSVWVANSADGTVTRIDQTTLVATPIPVGHGPDAVAVNAAGVWVANAGDNSVVRVDPGTNAVAGSTRVGDGPTALLITPTALWVANGRDGTVMRLDPRSGTVRKTIHLGGAPDGLASAAGKVWVSVAAAAPRSPAAGGVARLTVKNDFQSYDPALQTVSPLLYTTCASLVTYPDEPAPEGARVVPEVAESVPVPTNDGKTYTFEIRPGFRFSPPSNEPVTAATFKSTIERVLRVQLRSGGWVGDTTFSSIVGYRAYEAGNAHGLSGIVTRGRTLTIRLSSPDGRLLADLASGAACAVPRGTPAPRGGLDTIPSAGPYYIASYTPRQQVVLRRNPNYQGDRPHRPDEIVVSIGVDPSRALAEIEAGKADYALDDLPRAAGPRLEAEYGPRSKAAKEGHQQYFIGDTDGTRYLHMNTSRQLFSNVRLRRAVNYAIDRVALVEQGRRFAEVNPFNAGEATDAYLPPAILSGGSVRVYPLHPDLRRAKRLAGHVHATAIMYTPNEPPWLQEAQIVRRNLKPLGIDVRVQEMPIGLYFARIARRGEPWDLAVSGWALATDPVEDLGIFAKEPPGLQNSNLSRFHDRAFDREVSAAERLSGTRRSRAAARLELELERNFAPVAAFSINARRDFFSARMGCQLYQPFFGIDLAALCVRN